MSKSLQESHEELRMQKTKLTELEKKVDNKITLQFLEKRLMGYAQFEDLRPIETQLKTFVKNAHLELLTD